MRDGYSKKDPAFTSWLATGMADLANYNAFSEMIKDAVGRGVSVRRARIVGEPWSAYIEFEYAITATLNLAAGEEVRWLPRRRASDIALPGNDFWLFDGEFVQLNHFDGDGVSAGHELSHDPQLVQLCASAFEAVWARATPHEDYRPS